MHVLAHAYGSNAVLKSPRDCTTLGLSMRRVGLVDITVGNATCLGASQRSATRRCASHHIATQRLSRWGSPAARARLARTVPPQAPVAPRRPCEAKYMRADEFAASRRAVLERRYRLTARARSGRPPSSNPDQPICGLQRWSLAPGSVRLSQKSHKVAVLLGIILLSALSLPDRREGGSGGSRCRRAVRALLGWFKGP
jgi:hypothetical protein